MIRLLGVNRSNLPSLPIDDSRAPRAYLPTIALCSAYFSVPDPHLRFEQGPMLGFIFAFHALSLSLSLSLSRTILVKPSK